MMSPPPAWGEPPAEHAEVRRQLIALIQKRRRTTEQTRERPARLRFREIRHPESGYFLDRRTVWHVIVQLLESNVPLEQINLRKPPGKKAWVFKARLTRDGPLIYVKLQIESGATVVLRSFHRSRHHHD